MISLWCLANQESFRSVACRFGVAKSTAWESLHRIGTLLLAVSQDDGIIKWPTGQRALTIIREHEEKSSVPGVIGAIDGSHIAIKAPIVSPASSVCRKGSTLLLLQGVCDDMYLSTDCYAGEAGSIHDACLYRRSDLASDILDGTNQFPNDSHLLGDGAYTLTTKVLVPFKNNGHLTDRQKNHNITLSCSRATIEQAFALLKGRFRRLKYMETTRIEIACLSIMASCILHNVCILEGDDIPSIDICSIIYLRTLELSKR